MTGSESYLFHCLRPDATSTERFQVFPTERSMVLERRKRLATDDAAAEIDKQLARFESRQLQALQADLSAAQATLADAARFRTVQAQLESKRAALAGGLQELASKRKQVQATREQVIEQQRQIAQKAQ
jgi:hypothetical protein